MRRSLFPIILVAVAVVVVGPVGRVPLASAAEPVVAGVLLPRLSPSLEPIRADIEKSIVSGAALAGASVRSPDRVREATTGHGDLVSCVTVACALEIARLLEAAVVVSSEIENTKRSFTVRVTVVQAGDGRELGRETATCKSTEPCAPIPDTTRDVAREAMRKALEQIRVDQQVAAGNQRPIDPGLGGDTGGAPSEISSANSATEGPGSTTKGPATNVKQAAGAGGGGGRSGASSAWPWVALMGAGVSIAAGAYVLTKVDNSQTSCEQTGSAGRVCHDVRDAAVEGWSLIGLGALAAGAGLYLYFGRDGDGGGARAITLGPRGVLLRGAF